MVAYTIGNKGDRASAKGKFTFSGDCHTIFAGYVYRTVSGARFTGSGPSGGSRSFLDSLAALLSQFEACLNRAIYRQICASIFISKGRTNGHRHKYRWA